jgi:hypothetical protein
MKRGSATYPALVGKRVKINSAWTPPTSGADLKPLHDPYTGSGGGTVSSISSRSGYKSMDSLHATIRADQPFSTPTTAGIIIPIWVDTVKMKALKKDFPKGTVIPMTVKPGGNPKIRVLMPTAGYASSKDRVCAITAEHTTMSSTSPVTSIATVAGNTTELQDMRLDPVPASRTIKAGTTVYVCFNGSVYATTSSATAGLHTCLFACRVVLDANVARNMLVRPLVHISTFY